MSFPQLIPVLTSIPKFLYNVSHVACLAFPNGDLLAGTYFTMGYARYFYNDSQVFECLDESVGFIRIHPLFPSLTLPFSALIIPDHSALR